MNKKKIVLQKKKKKRVHAGHNSYISSIGILRNVSDIEVK